MITAVASLAAPGSTVTLGGAINTANGAVDFSGTTAVVLGANITIDTDPTGGTAAATPPSAAKEDPAAEEADEDDAAAWRRASRRPTRAPERA